MAPSAGSESTAKQYLFGGMSAMVAEFTIFPFDTAKTRLQIQGQTGERVASSLAGRTVYRGTFHTIYSVVREEGFFKLYGGIKPALLRQSTYGTLRIGMYFHLKSILTKMGSGQESFFKNSISGIIAGASASALCNPTDVVKVRLQARTASTSMERLSLPRCFVYVYREDGIRGMWRGVGPSASRAAVIAGVQLPTYDIVKKTLLNSPFDMSEGTAVHFAASFCAGFTSVAASNPVDVLKTRMMNDKNIITKDVEREYSGAVNCAIKTLRTEGFFALYRGVVPNWMRTGPWNIVFFMTLEQIRLADSRLFGDSK